jgi:hypothetical protein
VSESRVVVFAVDRIGRFIDRETRERTRKMEKEFAMGIRRQEAEKICPRITANEEKYNINFSILSPVLIREY